MLESKLNYILHTEKNRLKPIEQINNDVKIILENPNTKFFQIKKLTDWLYVYADPHLWGVNCINLKKNTKGTLYEFYDEDIINELNIINSKEIENGNYVLTNSKYKKAIFNINSNTISFFFDSYKEEQGLFLLKNYYKKEIGLFALDTDFYNTVYDPETGEYFYNKSFNQIEPGLFVLVDTFGHKALFYNIIHKQLIGNFFDYDKISPDTYIYYFKEGKKLYNFATNQLSDFMGNKIYSDYLNDLFEIITLDWGNKSEKEEVKEIVERLENERERYDGDKFIDIGSGIFILDEYETGKLLYNSKSNKTQKLIKPYGYGDGFNTIGYFEKYEKIKDGIFLLTNKKGISYIYDSKEGLYISVFDKYEKQENGYILISHVHNKKTFFDSETCELTEINNPTE